MRRLGIILTGLGVAFSYFTLSCRTYRNSEPSTSFFARNTKLTWCISINKRGNRFSSNSPLHPYLSTSKPASSWNFSYAFNTAGQAIAYVKVTDAVLGSYRQKQTRLRFG